jgi:general secretion pathway protein I
MTRRRLPRRGFTLLEVMVALAILAMGLVAISDVVGGAMRNHARAKALDVATLLARGKMAETLDRYEEEGFRDSDEGDDGDFSEEGHPDVAWKLEVKKPSVDLAGENACAALLGANGLSALLGDQTAAGGSGPQTGGGGGGSGPTAGLSPMALMMQNLVKTQCTSFGEVLKKAVREVRLTVSWPDGKQTESFAVVTHMVVLQARKGQP